MQTNIQLATFFAFILVIGGCRHRPANKEQIIQQANIVLADSSFLFINKDLKSADFKGLIDTSIHGMDSSLKSRIFLPIYKAEQLPMDANYATSDYLHCDLIAKEKKVGYLTPIIIHVHGDDYNAFYYVLLDNNFSTHSFYRLMGYFGSDASGIIGDSMEEVWSRGFVLKDTEIRSYDLTEYVWMDSLKNYEDYDSVSYLSRVLPSGKIQTDKVDSVRFKKPKSLS